MPKIVVSVKHIDSDLSVVFTRIRFPKTYEAIPTDIRFETDTVANIHRLSQLNQNLKLLEASLRRMTTSAGQRVQFVLMDDKNTENNFEMNVLCYQFAAKLVLCWSLEELVRYVESFAERPETVENRIKKRRPRTPAEALTKIPSISTPDANRLLTKHPTLRSLLLSHDTSLTSLKGINTTKASTLLHSFSSPLLP